ncbi:MAG: family 43 glycosylhydrolase [Rikenellaceae bacterium]|nr:family 43 glycosylhydrolase [Rikenellaceae bacterium]
MNFKFGTKKIKLFATVILSLFVVQALSAKSGEEMSAYLFSYFTGGSGEQIRFAVSADGYEWFALNNNEPILNSAEISTSGGVRDPHILRGHDGKTFYMVVTDMNTSKNGWTPNTAMVLLKSDNLIDWTHSVIDIPTQYPEYKEMGNIWAPQTIYDKDADKYMVYWSMTDGKTEAVFYYAYANDDFTAFEDPPNYLFGNPNGKSAIDADIIEKDGQYHLFFKTEGENKKGIMKAVSDKLTSGYVMVDKYLNPTDKAVEGSCVFLLIGSEEWILMYDVYRDREFQFTKSRDLLNFSVIDDEIKMDFRPRHGTVMQITSDEARRVIDKWGINGSPAIYGFGSDKVKKINLEIDQAGGNVRIPVRYGTNLKKFNPEPIVLPGYTVIPTKAQNFTNGAIDYTVSTPDGKSKTYSVDAYVANNPILEGYYADPEILYSEKTGRFYLYPTSDGYHEWSGNYFKVFSSDNLVEWTDEGIIIDLPSDVSWADRNAWAPCIIEKKIDGEYKYFYYYTAAQKIGVAVADSPTGPFVDSGRPIVGTKPEGINRGQEIDPDVFTDPETGKSYLYWGNGYLAVVELNDDMVSYKEGSLKIITPPSTFREGAYVIYRNGIYYMMWSENDTRDENYRVRYATMDSPTGPLNIPENNLILSKVPEQGIYGTGHHSVIQIPGRDEWYIVYHRFNRPQGINMGRSAGYHREVCIDKLEFGENGEILPVIPTLEGIEPVRLQKK